MDLASPLNIRAPPSEPRSVGRGAGGAASGNGSLRQRTRIEKSRSTPSAVSLSPRNGPKGEAFPLENYKDNGLGAAASYDWGAQAEGVSGNVHAISRPSSSSTAAALSTTRSSQWEGADKGNPVFLSPGDVDQGKGAKRPFTTERNQAKDLAAYLGVQKEETSRANGAGHRSGRRSPNSRVGEDDNGGDDDSDGDSGDDDENDEDTFNDEVMQFGGVVDLLSE